MEDLTRSLFGNYRAKVISNKDKENFGRVLVWIPDIMVNIPDTKGLWARPANNPIGGRNNTEGKDKTYYAGTSYIPPEGSWVWIFFEGGNINRPYYFAALDLQNAEVLPENRVGKNVSEKWVIFKSHEGRTIIVSDDEDDARIEITGKKRKIKNPPSGDTDSVYKIDENQTVILLDERKGKEKILIRTYKGDFINFNIEKQSLFIEVEKDIEIKSHGSIKITAEEDIDIKSTLGNIKFQAGTGKIDIKSGDDMKITTENNMDILSQSNLKYTAGGSIHGQASGNMNHDAANIQEQMGTSTAASSASDATEAEPEGER